ncbi:HAD domain-containing protein [Roseateles toxinivorans]|uniref:FCP1 homology domain-containing protein n=1 Tax=Roseateles toxinivorans TaxID=270368 RepID=A0A4R6QG04_9BURK|nr:HAD domain-containing protein [Roseateles toxinivorans]TDP60449.1 hypothetical protein DES47_11649 [Roseateles toxinivorans]
MTRGHGQLLVYVDLDGVVHHEAVYVSPSRGIYIDPSQAPGRVLFEWVDILVELLDPYPDIQLVLSSSWCRRPGYARTLERLPKELRHRFVGGTFHRRIHGSDPGTEWVFANTPRGEQIWADVLRRQPLDWLALDDDGDRWPAWCRDKLLLLDGEVGISSPAAQEQLRQRLVLMSSKLP